MAFLLVETTDAVRTTIYCESDDGSAQVRPIAQGSAWNVALAALRQLTPAEIHELKVNEIGHLHRAISQVHAMKQAAEAAGYSVDDRFGPAEPVVVPVESH